MIMFLVGPAAVLAATLWTASYLHWSKTDSSNALMVLVLGAELGYLCALSFALQTGRMRRWLGFVG